MSKRKHASSEPSQRQRRVGEQLRHIMVETLQRGHFHQEILLNAQGITVTEVQASPDLKHAVAYVIALGGADMDELLPALNADAHIFQKDIGRQANLKFTPRVKFRLDESFENSQRINQLLEEVAPHNKDEDSDGA